MSDPATEERRQAMQVMQEQQHADCAWRKLAQKATADRDKARAQLAEATSMFLHSRGQIYVARATAGPCLLCGLPIRRNDAVEVASTGTAPQWRHCFCPDKDG